MVKVKIISDDFMNGINHIKKGEVIDIPKETADFIVANNDGKIVKPRKSATYKTRVIKADV